MTVGSQLSLVLLVVVWRLLRSAVCLGSVLLRVRICPSVSMTGIGVSARQRQMGLVPRRRGTPLVMYSSDSAVGASTVLGGWLTSSSGSALGVVASMAKAGIGSSCQAGETLLGGTTSGLASCKSSSFVCSLIVSTGSTGLVAKSCSCSLWLAAGRCVFGASVSAAVVRAAHPPLKETVFCALSGFHFREGPPELGRPALHGGCTTIFAEC
ncbi:hypothetical protein DFJ73DRAFT_845215 [Zopfochytrium polystomum]|nr:hypothetical protein DFJ73DRAFT_845215 [Zopfochytrium polystomum]